MMSRPIVIKFGGEIVESAEDLQNLISSVKALVGSSERVILVHGGGPLATKLSEQLELKTQKVGGRRVTCAETLEVMKMALPGIINSNILAGLRANGVRSASASAISFIEATRRPPKVVSGSQGEEVDFGFVGDIKEVSPVLLNHLLAEGYSPVVSPLCSDNSGQILNINADTVAVQIARAVKAKALVLVTKVGGVFGDLEDPSSRLASLTVSEAKSLITVGTIAGGMIPKLEESFVLLEEGLEAFHIVGTDNSESIRRELLAPGSVGTAVVKEPS
jgi:acetylglutamate kinase